MFLRTGSCYKSYDIFIKQLLNVWGYYLFFIRNETLFLHQTTNYSGCVIHNNPTHVHYAVYVQCVCLCVFSSDTMDVIRTILVS